MTIKTKSKNKLIIFSLIAITGSAMFSWLWQEGRADQPTLVDGVQTADDSANQDKINELQKRADVYREIIEIKKKQGESLNNQLSIADSSIDAVQAQISTTAQQIEDYNSQITRTERQIKEKELIIKAQIKVLGNLIQTYHEVNIQSPLISFLTDGNVASFIVKKDRITQTGDKIRDLVDSVKATKDELEKQNKDIDNKKGEVVLAQEKLKDQSDKLATVKSQKQNLLDQTKGEEARYAQLLARVEAQKQELLDIDQFFVASGLSVDSYPKPDSKYYAPISWYYSQRDPKWGNENIGNTKTLMKSYGCAVTAVSMVFKEHGGDIDPGELANEPIFSGDLINWPISWTNPKVLLTENGKGHGNINWSVIDAQIAKGNPVIVYIGKTKGSGGHYVVIHHKTKDGDYVVHDPYFGPNIYLNTSRALIGAMGTSSSTVIDQMIIYN